MRSADRALASLALPAIGGLAFTMLFNLADTFFVGRMGAAPLAAVSASAFLYWALEALSEIPTLGGRARVAQAVGRGSGARAEAGRALALALLLGLVCMLLGLSQLEGAFELMGLGEEIRIYGRPYLGILMGGAHGILLLRTVEGIFHGHGDTRTPMLLQGGALLSNIALDPLLIFGPGIFPTMGTAGAALATVVCQFSGAAIGLSILHRRGWLAEGGLSRDPSRWLRPWADTRKMLAIGLPVALVGTVFCGVYLGLTRIVSSFGMEAVAALGLGHRVESLGYFSAVGYSAAAAALVGQAVGAGDIDRARAVGRALIRQIGLLGAILGSIMILGSRPIAGAFIGDPLTISLAASYLVASGLVQPCMGWWVGLAGAFGGAGRTLMPMLLVLPIVLSRIPLSMHFSEDGGPVAVWWVICATAAVNGFLMLGLWLAGRWAEGLAR